MRLNPHPEQHRNPDEIRAWKSVSGEVFGFARFPFLMPSSLDSISSLTIRDASSSKTTLGLVLVAVMIFMPLVLAYMDWVQRIQ